MNQLFAKGLVLGGMLVAALSAQAEWYLTYDELDDANPCTSGKCVAWLKDDGNDTEVMFYDGKTTVQLSNDDFNDGALAMAKKYVVWVHDIDATGNLSEIMLWDGKTVRQLSNGLGGTKMGRPHTDGKYVVWAETTGASSDIILWNGSGRTQLPVNQAEDNFAPKVSAGRVVWYATDGTPTGDTEIYLWDDGVITPLTANITDDTDPVIEGKLIAWIGEDEANGDTDVILNDGTFTNILSPATATGDVNSDLSISKKCLTWSEDDGVDNEIFLWEKELVTQITDNAFDDTDPANYGNKLTWLFDDPRSTQYEIMYRNSKGGKTQITNNDRRDRTPCFNGKTIYWQRTMGGGGTASGTGEIYYFPGKTKLP